MPSLAPSHTTRQPVLRSSSATANPGKTWPPVPPAMIKIVLIATKTRRANGHVFGAGQAVQRAAQARDHSLHPDDGESKPSRTSSYASPPHQLPVFEVDSQQ